LPTWSTVYNSGNPWTFAQMMTEQGGDPAVLQNVSFAAGEQIYFRVGPNDWTGLDLTIVVPGLTGKITGKVLQTGTTTGIGGAYVQLVGTAVGTQTASDGSYTIEDIPAGVYSLGVYKQGYFSSTSSISVASGMTISKDLFLSPFVGLDIARRAIASASQTLVDAYKVNDGDARLTGWLPAAPAAGDWVQLTWSDPVTIAKVLVDSAGPTQDYYVQSSPDGTTWTNLEHVTSAELDHTHWAEVIDLLSPITTQYLRVLNQTAAAGAIWSLECYRPKGSISGYVKDPSGAGIPGSTVYAYEMISGGRGPSRLPMSATTLGDGSYTIAVPEGQAGVTACTLDSIAVSSGATPLNVTAGLPTSAPDLVITTRAGVGGACTAFSDNFNGLAYQDPAPNWDVDPLGDWFGSGTGRYQAGRLTGNYTRVKTSLLPACIDSVIEVDTDGHEIGIQSRYQDSSNYLLNVYSFNELFYWHEHYNGTWPFTTAPAPVVLDNNGVHVRSVVAGNKAQGFITDGFNTYWTDVATIRHITSPGPIGLLSNEDTADRTFDNFVAHATSAPAQTPVAPGAAKAAGPGWYGAIKGIVTAAFSDYNSFVVESEDRSSAITVSPWPTGQVVSENQEVVISGTVRADGTLELGGFSPTGATKVVKALGTNNRDITGIVGNSGLANKDLLVSSWLKVLDTPIRLDDGTIRFHISDAYYAPPEGRTVVVPVPGTTPLFSDNFDSGKSPLWVDVYGTTYADAGKLVADRSSEHILYVSGFSVYGVTVSVQGVRGAAKGVMVKYTDINNYVLALYSTLHKIFGMAEKHQGNWVYWIDTKSTASITGDLLTLTANVTGNTVTATLTDGISTVSSIFVSQLTGPGMFGLEQYPEAGADIEYFDNFQAYLAFVERQVPADCVQVIIPASVNIPEVDLPSANDYVKVTGIACKGLAVGGDLRAIMIRKPEDLTTGY
ncbi:MAG: carboxypeptidase regulatory-like domain-containing protein, partial [Armatimonadetes bacterium]|nr:carboxypeptidase regulatory-like domain-containing protein [Armatimonadota bacterium]